MISIVIPIFNEEQFLKQFISDLIASLNIARLKYEIILSENGSQDKTLSLAKKLTQHTPQLKVLTSKFPNYGLAVKSGFLSATGDYLVLFDLDYYDIQFIIKSLPLLGKYDGLVGAKMGSGAKDTRNFLRRFTTYVFSVILKSFFHTTISDTHGIKILNRKKFLPLIKKTKFTKEIFDTELLIRAQYEGLRIGEIPVTVIEKRSSRTSIIKRIFRTFLDLLRLKIHLAREYRGISVK